MRKGKSMVQYDLNRGKKDMIQPKLQSSIRQMADRIYSILSDTEPSIYLYGSVTFDDFQLGWSDIDILILTQTPIEQHQAERLVTLRQEMQKEQPDNRYFSAFEGGMLTLSAFADHKQDRVVYWGTSGQRITDTYIFDSFCMVELLESGILLAGREIRERLQKPAYQELHADVQKHYDTIRKYAQQTDRSLYSFGWLLDIARGIYTLRTGKVIAKTSAGEWALKEKLCPAPEIMEMALEVRRNPWKFKSDEKLSAYAETLGTDVQAFADVLQAELTLVH